MRYLFLAVAVAGCGVDRSPLDTGMCGLAANTVTQASYVDTTSRWAKKSVSVCWINPQDGKKSDRKMVQDAVTYGWDRHIDLDFVWSDEPCGGCEDIRIAIRDERPYALTGLWKFLHTNAIPTVVLNFTFENWDNVCRSEEDIRKYCVIRAANHEFGHNLGFSHEQNRPDTPEWCVSWLDPEDFDGSKGDAMSPEWDADSIMNYCSIASTPSPTDILTAQKIYGVETE